MQLPGPDVAIIIGRMESLPMPFSPPPQEAGIPPKWNRRFAPAANRPGLSGDSGSAGAMDRYIHEPGEAIPYA